MGELQIFKNAEFGSVRTITVEGEPYFVVSSLELEREQLQGQLRQLSGAKKKLTDMLDRLDVSDKHYDRKYQDTHDRLDNLYDKIGDIDEQLQDVNEKIRMAYENQITSKQVYQIFTCFDKIYFEKTDMEKKEFFRNFIDEIELHSERQSDGRIVKQINFNFQCIIMEKKAMQFGCPTKIQSSVSC